MVWLCWVFWSLYWLVDFWYCLLVCGLICVLCLWVWGLNRGLLRRKVLFGWCLWLWDVLSDCCFLIGFWLFRCIDDFVRGLSFLWSGVGLELGVDMFIKLFCKLEDGFCLNVLEWCVVCCGGRWEGGLILWVVVLVVWLVILEFFLFWGEFFGVLI